MDKDAFLEDLFWTSYRYCIGRHSYVSTLANGMAEYFYDKIGTARKENIAQDIRRTMADSLQFQPFSIHFEWSIPTHERKPLELLIGFLNDLSQQYDGNENRVQLIQDELKIIDSISFYKDSETNTIQYSLSKTDNPRFEHTVYEHELLDFLPWMDLASLFDVPHHKIAVCVDENGQEIEYEVFESYINDSVVLEQNERYATLKLIPWKYKKVYRIVSDGISNRFLEPNLIKQIKDKG